MTPRLSGHFSIFGLVFFVLKLLLGIANNGVVKILLFFFIILKPSSPARILIYRTRAITKTPDDSLRDRQSKGKGIWARDSARGRSASLARYESPFPFLSNACYAG